MKQPVSKEDDSFFHVFTTSSDRYEQINVISPDHSCSPHVKNNPLQGEWANVGPHWPGSCRCTPSRPAASPCSCIPCPDSWRCCSSVGSASSQSSANGTRAKRAKHIDTGRLSVRLTACLLPAPTPGRWRGLVHRFIISVQVTLSVARFFTRTGREDTASAAGADNDGAALSGLVSPSPPHHTCPSPCHAALSAAAGRWMRSLPPSWALAEMLPSQT